MPQAAPIDPRAHGWQPDPSATIRSLRARLHSLQGRYEDAEARYRAVSGRLARGTAPALLAEIETLKARIAELEMFEMLAEQLKGRVAELEERVKDLEALEADHVATITEWHAFKVRADKALLSAQREVHRRTKEMAATAKSLQALEQERVDSEQERVDLKQQRVDLLTALEEQNKEHASHIKDYDLKMLQAANALEPLHDVATNLQQQVQDAHHRQHDLEAELAESQRANAVLQAAIDKSSETIAAMQRDQASLEADLEALQFDRLQDAGSIVHLRDEINAARDEVATTKAELAEVAPLYQQATATVASLHSRVGDLNAALDRSAAEVFSLKKQMRDLKKVQALHTTTPPVPPSAKRTRTAPARYVA